jgi:pimeloyl-ACP methyl ester carboxylesterase
VRSCILSYDLLMPNSVPVVTRHGAIVIEDTSPRPAGGEALRSLIFLHGGAANLRSWDGVIRELSHRCVAIDLPGHGITLIDPISFEDLNEALLEIVETLEIHKPVLVGHSFGGLAAVAAGSMNGSAYGGVIAVDPWLSNAEVRHGHTEVDSVVQDLSNMTWPWRTATNLDEEVERVIEGMTLREDMSQLRAMVRRGYRRQSNGEFVRFPRREDEIEGVKNNWSIDIDKAYQSVGCPLFIALAGDDKRRLARRMRIVESYAAGRRIDSRDFDCGHDIPGYRPQELAGHIHRWVAELGD